MTDSPRHSDWAGPDRSDARPGMPSADPEQPAWETSTGPGTLRPSYPAPQPPPPASGAPGSVGYGQPPYQQPNDPQPAYQPSTYQQSAYQQPTYQQPTYEQPGVAQSGYGQPAYPPQPASGASYGGYGPPGYAPPRSTNGLAIAAMIVSIVGFGPIGAIMGHVARRQIRERNEDGDGFALAGIIVGWATTGIWVLACCALGGLRVFG